jgi:cardiolipin synthase
MSFADKLSVIRIIVIPFFISLLIYSRYNPYLKYIAVALFALAMLSDFFDGLVARIKKEKTQLGAIIDPVADKLLMLITFPTLYLLRHSLPVIHYAVLMPLGVVIVVISRDLIILLGFGILKMLKINVVISPSIWGKLTTFFQMITILSVLLEIPFSPIIWNLAIVFTIISGIGYIVKGVQAINVADRN